MKNFEISNATSGQVLGVYHAESKDAALDMLARDAGYADYAEVLAICPASDSDVLIAEIGAENSAA